MNYKYGWIPSLPDHRDLVYKVSTPISLPPLIDLRPGMPTPYNQGQLGSCTANGIAGSIEYERKKQGLPELMPSRLFIYYNERVIEHTVKSDSGATIRDGIKAVNSKGVCPESEWGYDITKFTKKPPKKCYKDAAHDRVLQYAGVPQYLTSMKECLAEGYPIVLGFTVYESFESSEVAKTGIIPMPGKNESALGGHCIMVVGYDDSKQWFICRNSWGDSWGDKGYFYMPYQYLTNPDLTSDFWTIRLVEN
jgi:C1A family cysteine protease